MKRVICIAAGSLLCISLFGCNVRQVPIPTMNFSPDHDAGSAHVSGRHDGSADRNAGSDARLEVCPICRREKGTSYIR